ncbi:hypothetical protein GCM10023067_31240 [Aminobacter aganoensis]
MKHILISVGILAAIAGGWVHTVTSVSYQAEANERFVQLAKSDAGGFSNDVEEAVGECVQLQNYPDDVSRRVRAISGKIVAKIMHVRATRDGNVDLKPQIRLWLETQLEPEIKSLTEAEFELLVKAIGKIIGSPNDIKCIVSTAVSRRG